MATAKQCAAHLFLSLRRFNDLLERGVIQRQPRGEYDLPVVREAYLRRLSDVVEERGSAGLDLRIERARLASEQADAQHMKNVAARAELLPREHVQAAVAASFDRVRDKLSALPERVAPEAFGRRSIAEVREALTRGVMQALAELAGTRVAGRTPS